MVGAALGAIWPAGAGAIRILGEVFVRLIQMLVVPAVLVTIAAGISSLGDPRRLGPIGGRTVGLFAQTTLITVLIGVAVGLIVRPGEGIALADVAPHIRGTPVSPIDQLLIYRGIVDALSS